MFGTNPAAWLRLHHLEHARQMADARECAIPPLTLPAFPPFAAAPACATC